MLPARFSQALAPLVFALLIDTSVTWALTVSTLLGLSAVGALLILHQEQTYRSEAVTTP